MDHNYLITGSTGFIGQHILFEVLHETLIRGDTGNIYLLIRQKEGRDTLQTVINLLRHPDTPDYIRQHPIQQCMSRIQIIESDLRAPNLGNVLSGHIDKSQPLQVFHSAGSVNLHSGDSAEQDIKNNNFLGTQCLLEALKGFNCRFMFVSTAFSSGIRHGLIDDDFLGAQPGPFRNPYEASKATIEAMVKAFGDETGMPIQIARPSVVMGRLIDAPHHVTSKFDVLYGLARFFWVMGQKAGDQAVRLQVNSDAGLNILPVDYVAKACVRMSRTTMEQLNIVHPQSVPHVCYLGRTLDKVGFRPYSFVEDKPSAGAGLEKAYYRSVGAVFDPYLNSPASEFDAEALMHLMNDIPTPDILGALDELIGFAIERQFEAPDLEQPAKPNNCVPMVFPDCSMGRQAASCPVTSSLSGLTKSSVA